MDGRNLNLKNCLEEKKTITFIGATTENPFFAVNKALVSRSRIFTLLPLAENDLQKIIQKVIIHYSKKKRFKKDLFNSRCYKSFN